MDITHHFNLFNEAVFMKTLSFAFMATLILSTSALAENRAIQITLRDYKPSVDKTAVNLIQTTLGQAVSDGIIDTVIRYNRDNSRFMACIELTETVESQKLTTVLSQLSSIKPRLSANYKLTPIQGCNTDETLFCVNNPLACFSQSFINSPKYADYVSKAQFNWALNDILPGKIMMEMRLNEGNISMDLNQVSNVGLPPESKNCFVITSTAAYDIGEATITCGMKGNSAVLGKIITLTRSINNGKVSWSCDSDLDKDAKLKYASKQCRGTILK